MGHIEGPHLLAQEWVDKNWQISVSRRELSKDFKNHWHEYFEIEIILSGSGRQVLNGKEYPMLRGSAYLLRPTDFHEIRVDSKMELYNVVFSAGLLSDELLQVILNEDNNMFVNVDQMQFEEVTAIAKLMYNEFGSGNAYKKQYMHNLLECLFIWMLRRMDIPHPQKEEPLKTPVQKAILYMHLNFKDSPTLTETAREINLNPNYFSEMFRKATGQTYISYLTTLKLNYAKKLLRSSGLSVTEICFASGFNSMSNFLKVFKERHGKSPTSF